MHIKEERGSAKRILNSRVMKDVSKDGISDGSVLEYGILRLLMTGRDP